MIFDDKTQEEILQSLIAEAAKAVAEIRCAKNDLAQADTRLKFLLSALNHTKDKEMK